MSGVSSYGNTKAEVILIKMRQGIKNIKNKVSTQRSYWKRGKGEGIDLDSRTISDIAFSPYICSLVGPEIFSTNQQPATRIFKSSTETSSTSNWH